MASSRPSTPHSAKFAARAPSIQLSEQSPPSVASEPANNKFAPPAAAAKTWVPLVSVFMAIFLVALDRTIIFTVQILLCLPFNSFG